MLDQCVAILSSKSIPETLRRRPLDCVLLKQNMKVMLREIDKISWLTELDTSSLGLKCSFTVAAISCEPDRFFYKFRFVRKRKLEGLPGERYIEGAADVAKQLAGPEMEAFFASDTFSTRQEMRWEYQWLLGDPVEAESRAIHRNKIYGWWALQNCTKYITISITL